MSSEDIESLHSADSDTVNCAICQHNINDKTNSGYNVIRRFDCGHKFHFKCLYSKHLTTCPLCRGDTDILCKNCNIQIDMLCQIESSTLPLCKACLSDELYTRICGMKDIMYTNQRNITICQYLLTQTFDAVDNGLDKETAFDRIKEDLIKFFGFCDTLHRRTII